jgi:membrane protease YdiL (CAAX protease family)
LFFTVAVLPVALVTTNYWLAKKYDTAKFFILNAIIICSCIVISARLHFLNWADSIGSRTHPDGETLEVIAFERSVGLIVTIIGLIIVFVRIYQKQKVQSFQHSESQPPTSAWQKQG